MMRFATGKWAQHGYMLGKYGKGANAAKHRKVAKCHTWRGWAGKQGPCQNGPAGQHNIMDRTPARCKGRAKLPVGMAGQPCSKGRANGKGMQLACRNSGKQGLGQKIQVSKERAKILFGL